MMEKFIRWHKLKIGKVQTFLRINDYETLWLSWLKGLIMGIIIMSLLTGCYIYEGTTYTDPNYNTGYYQPNTLTYYQTHYVPTLDLYYWNDLPYWGYYDGWYYYYGYRHIYPWWYYYSYRPAYYYNVYTHVHCHVGHRKYVTRPKGNRRLDNKNNRTYNVNVVNTNGVKINNNSNIPVKFQNKPNRTNTNTKPNRININKTDYNRTFNINQSKNNNSNKTNNKININRSNKSNNKVNINRTNTNRNNSNRSNKTNNRRPR